MSRLTIFADEMHPERFEQLERFEDIVAGARAAGVRFERWAAERELPPSATQDEVLAGYADAVAQLKRECGFVTADVISVHPQTPNHPELRKKFLSEHTHAEDEARFFVEGAGLFFIHRAPRVYALVCERGDLINVPAGTPHWFDMGPTPRLKCIRLFCDPSGWVARFTGDAIADRFPRFGE
jgi:1,2-dihydroxy-3-keto-5-methylthiopentene dioxygenase